MASFQSHYEILGVQQCASIKEITIAYRKLALKSHPDKNKSDIASATQRFQMISNAHDTLKDAHMRRRYDARLPQLKAAWTAEQFQHAQERAQQQKRQAAYARKSADLESKKAQISRVIQLQQQEVLRLRAQWDSLLMGVIPQGFEDYSAYGGDEEEIHTAIRNLLCQLLLDLQTKMQKANSIAAEVDQAIEKFNKQQQA